MRDKTNTTVYISLNVYNPEQYQVYNLNYTKQLPFVSSSCVPYIASFSELSIFDCPFGILLPLFSIVQTLFNRYVHNSIYILSVIFFSSKDVFQIRRMSFFYWIPAPVTVTMTSKKSYSPSLSLQSFML